jgi:hypothetical protein
MAPFTSRRRSDGKPRKLRKAKHPTALRRQARKIVEARRGKKLPKSSLVHHGNGINSTKGLKILKGRRSHQRIHPGRQRRRKR